MITRVVPKTVASTLGNLSNLCASFMNLLFTHLESKNTSYECSTKTGEDAEGLSSDTDCQGLLWPTAEQGGILVIGSIILAEVQYECYRSHSWNTGLYMAVCGSGSPGLLSWRLLSKAACSNYTSVIASTQSQRRILGTRKSKIINLFLPFCNKGKLHHTVKLFWQVLHKSWWSVTCMFTLTFLLVLSIFSRSHWDVRNGT